MFVLEVMGFCGVIGSAISLAAYFQLKRFIVVSQDPNYQPVDCYYCVNAKGKPQGWLELFNSAEYQGRTGYVPATRINGNVIPCPVCGGRKTIHEPLVKQDY